MLKDFIKYIYAIINVVIALSSLTIVILELGTGMTNITNVQFIIVAIIAIIMSINSYYICVAVFDGNKKGR